MILKKEFKGGRVNFSAEKVKFFYENNFGCSSRIEIRRICLSLVRNDSPGGGESHEDNREERIASTVFVAFVCVLARSLL